MQKPKFERGSSTIYHHRESGIEKDYLFFIRDIDFGNSNGNPGVHWLYEGTLYKLISINGSAVSFVPESATQIIKVCEKDMSSLTDRILNNLDT